MRIHEPALLVMLLASISDAYASDSDLFTRMQACQAQPQSLGCANILNLKAMVVEPEDLRYGRAPGHPLVAPLAHAVETYLDPGNKRAQDKDDDEAK